jgi:hypothetical protein
VIVSASSVGLTDPDADYGVPMGFLDRLLGRNQPPAADTPEPSAPDTSGTSGPDAEHDTVVDRAVEARRAAWASVGSIDPHVLAPAINPSFMGGPRWPALRQSFVRVSKPGSIILASDGLSDPWDDPAQVRPGRSGTGLEIFLETDDPEVAATEIGPLASTWAMTVVFEVAQNVAYNPGLGDMLDKYGVISFEIPNTPLPGREAGAVGVLLGLPAQDVPATVDTGSGTARLVAITVLTPAELDHVVTNGAQGRQDVVERLVASGNHHRSNLGRPSVI